MPDLKKLRSISFHRQSGRCYYCDQPMWCASPVAFTRQHGISPAQALNLQASAEHLTARCDGGRNKAGNVVAVCVYCNRHRHRARSPLDPLRFGEHVRARLAAGRWHGLRLRATSLDPGVIAAG